VLASAFQTAGQFGTAYDILLTVRASLFCPSAVSLHNAATKHQRSGLQSNIYDGFDINVYITVYSPKSRVGLTTFQDSSTSSDSMRVNNSLLVPETPETAVRTQGVYDLQSASVSLVNETGCNVSMTTEVRN
jgi:hypothetical protein